MEPKRQLGCYTLNVFSFKFGSVWNQFNFNSFSLQPFRFQSSFLAQDQPKGLDDDDDPKPLPRFAEVSDIQLYIMDNKIGKKYSIKIYVVNSLDISKSYVSFLS